MIAAARQPSVRGRTMLVQCAIEPALAGELEVEEWALLSTDG